MERTTCRYVKRVSLLIESIRCINRKLSSKKMADWIEKVRLAFFDRKSLNEIDNELEKRISAIISDLKLEAIVKELLNNSKEACVALFCRTLQNKEAVVAIEKLSESISLPTLDWIWSPDSSDNRPTIQLEWPETAKYKICTIENLLQRCKIELSDDQIYNLVLKLSFYSLEDAPWTNQKVTNIANSVIESFLCAHEDRVKSEKALLQRLLDDYIRDQLRMLSNIQGLADRKTTRLGTKKIGTDLSEKFKGINPLLGNQLSSRINAYDTWKWTNIGCVSVYYFILKASSSMVEDNQNLFSQFIKSNWGTIFPFFLNLIESADVMVKVAACKCLRYLLKIADVRNDHDLNIFSTAKEFLVATKDKNIILRADVGSLIESNVSPLLLNLPSYTPVDRSAFILQNAYPCLIHLHQLTCINFDQYSEKITELIDKYIVSSFVKVKDYPKLIMVLFEVVDSMIVPSLDGYFVVVANKLIYPILDILVDPFTIYSSDIVIRGLSVINHMFQILTEAQRESKYKYDILTMTLLLNKRVVKYEITDRSDEITRLTSLLRKAVERHLTDKEIQRLDLEV